MTATHISIAEAKSQHSRKRFILTRRDKPVAAIVSLEDLQWLEQREERQGLAAIAGQWQGFDEVVKHVEDLSALRNQGGMGRDASL